MRVMIDSILDSISLRRRDGARHGRCPPVHIGRNSQLHHWCIDSLVIPSIRVCNVPPLSLCRRATGPPGRIFNQQIHIHTHNMYAILQEKLAAMARVQVREDPRQDNLQRSPDVALCTF